MLQRAAPSLTLTHQTLKAQGAEEEEVTKEGSSWKAAGRA